MRVINKIRQKLTEEFAPEILEILDESHLHAGHAGHRPEGESHFNLTIRSQKLSNISRVLQHQKIYDCLSAEMATDIHALSIRIV